SIPGLARIDAKLLARLSGQQVPGALDVLGAEGFAVVPPYPVMQAERQLGLVLVPRPAGGKVRHDRLQTGLRYFLLVYDEVIEDTHHRRFGRECCLLVDRHARRAVPVVDLEDSALLLRIRRLDNAQSNQQPACRREPAKMSAHSHLPVLAFARHSRSARTETAHSRALAPSAAANLSPIARARTPAHPQS